MSSIDDLSEPHSERLGMLSDDEIVEELSALDPLPDESDSRWHEEPFDLFDAAGHLVALADEIGERRLANGIGLVLDKACFGDPGEMMRGLRHSLEAACEGDLSQLARVCADRSRSSRPGTRLWATSEIAILRDPALVDAIRDRFGDEESIVRQEAVRAAVMLAQTHPHEVRALLPEVGVLAESDTEDSVRDVARRALSEIGS